MPTDHNRLDGSSWQRLLERIRTEYDEIPGLSLTLSQASRFWDLDPNVCRNALESLVVNAGPKSDSSAD